MVALPKLFLLWIALFMLVVWLPALFAPKKMKKVLESTGKNHDILRIRWFITLLFWFLSLLVQYAFNGTWYVVFAIFGRLSLLKWITYMWFPQYMERKIKNRGKNPSMLTLMWIVAVVFAAFLTWVAIFKI